MTGNDRPRICEVLGVEVGERFTYPGKTGEFFVTAHGTLVGVDDDGEERPYMCASTLINCHDHIVRQPRFTEEEVTVLRYIDAAQKIKEIRRNECGTLEILFETEGLWVFPADMLPSLLPGHSVALSDIVGVKMEG